ncbi:spermatogenesis-associated protein 22 isoform X2 [Esox lucius]|uniref:Spermatogenesis associated 22 n=2 Tax=Esox lucius TaxID=8010 RepID=A0A3P8Z5M8_ESOLU|nr:spermatogenesis-associated protein 22 isoform X2 [Esox lucius]
MLTQSSKSSENPTAYTGYFQDQASRCPAPAGQTRWLRQGNQQQSQTQSEYPNSQRGPLGRSFGHPYKVENTGLQLGKQQPTVMRDYGALTDSRQSMFNSPRGSGSTHGNLVPSSYHSEMGQQQQAGYRPVQANPPELIYSQQSRPTPGPPSRPTPSTTCKPNPGPGLQKQKQDVSWKFKSTTNTGPQKPLIKDNGDTYQTQSTSKFQVKPTAENSLRILTAVIDGMRHWSRLKDRALYLFEIFATLDSAVTAGSHGAKNFLMRDGKEVVQCVFYENELELPRLIRGQVHRCVGNFDRTRDTLICVSVRAALPSEQRMVYESVKASDIEMRIVVKSLSEV